MTREKELDSSRQGLLQDGADTSSRQSLDESDASSSDQDFEELEYQDHPHRPRGGWSPRKRKDDGQKKDDEKQALAKPKRKGGCFRSKICWLISAILLGALLGLAGSAKWMFKKFGPKDGVRMPYPLKGS